MNGLLELTREEYRLVRKFRRMEDAAKERTKVSIDAALITQTAKRRDPEVRARFEGYSPLEHKMSF